MFNKIIKLVLVFMFLLVILSSAQIEVIPSNDKSQITMQEVLRYNITGESKEYTEKIEYAKINNSYIIKVYTNATSKKLKIHLYKDENLTKNYIKEKDLDLIDNQYYLVNVSADSVKKIKFDDASIVFAIQNESKIIYNFTDEGLGVQEVSLLKLIDGEYVISPEDIWVNFNQNSYKFGANDTTANQINDYLYIINSTYPITQKSNFVYQVKKTEKFNSITENDISWDYDFSDICIRSFNVSGILTTPNCLISLSQTLDSNNETRYVLLNYFKSNSSIDPTVVISNVSNYASLAENITLEPSPFSHLTINNSNITMYLSFDINVTNNTQDLSIHESNGFLIGALWNDTGWIGGAYQFKGNDYVESQIGQTNYTNGSISWWQKPNTAPNDGAWSGWWGRTTDTVNPSISCIKYTDNNIYCGWAGIDGDDRVVLGATSGNAPQGVWSHYVLTWGHLATTRLYYNGAEIGSQGSTNVGAIASGNPFRIGRQGGRNDAYFNGAMDEFMILNTTLSPDEILSLYNNQSPRFYPQGMQTFQALNITQNGSQNRINITSNVTDVFPQGNISLRIREWNGTNYYDNVSGWDNWNFSQHAVLAMHFDNLSRYGENNTNVTDFSGAGNNGSVFGGAQPNHTGIYGKAFSFMANNDYIQIKDSPTLDVSSTLTLSVWMYPSSNSQNGILVEKWRTGAGNDNAFVMVIGQDVSNNKFIFGVQESDDSAEIYVTSAGTFNANEWTHLVGTADGTNLRLYKNGVEDSNSPSSYDGTIKNIAHPVLIGTLDETAPATYNYNGVIDEVLILNRSLSATEVKELYIKGRLKYEAPKEFQVLSNGQNVNNFSLDYNGTHVLLEYNFTSDNTSFYTPYLRGGVKVETFNESITGEAIADIILPVVNTSLNKSLVNIVTGDVINLTANATDETGLSFGQIIVNDTGYVRYFNFSLNDATAAAFSQNITVACGSGCVINFTARANDTTNNFRTNDTIVTVADVTVPVVNTSFNVTTFTIGTVINFSANITDANGLITANITYNLSGVTWVNFTLSGTAAQIHNVTALTTPGVFNFTAYATDTSNNVKQNSTLIVVTDNILPIVNTSINNTSPKRYEVINITANITDETGLSFCQAITNMTGSIEYINYSMEGLTSSQCSQNFTISVGRGNVINFTIRVNDTSNNFRTNDTIITVADTAPIFSLALNNSNPKIFNTINFSATVNDSDEISMVIFSWNGTNGAWQNVSNTTSSSNGINYTANISLRQGSGHTIGWLFYSNDSFPEFTASSLNTFKVANTLPSITAFQPSTNQSYTQGTNVTFNITFSDLDEDVITIEWYINNTFNISNQNMSYIFNTIGTFNITANITDNESIYQFWLVNITALPSTPSGGAGGGGGGAPSSGITAPSGFEQLTLFGTEPINNQCGEGQQIFDGRCYNCEPERGYLYFNPDDRSVLCTLCNDGFRMENRECILKEEVVGYTYGYLSIFVILTIALTRSYFKKRYTKKPTQKDVPPSSKRKDG